MAFHLETDRLILRAFQDDDLYSFVAYRSDPAVAHYQSWEAPYSPVQAAEFIEELKGVQPGQPGEWYQVAIALKTTGEMIGDCAFHVLAEDPLQAEMGFTLAALYQGQGYGSEAVTCLLAYLFDDLSLHRVRAFCDVENLASARLLERVGLRREGHFIENLWFKGRWASEYAYAILRREWQEKKNSQDKIGN
jgi:aminoglycoside 6'-N-acetyltransferase